MILKKQTDQLLPFQTHYGSIVHLKLECMLLDPVGWRRISAGKPLQSHLED